MPVVHIGLDDTDSKYGMCTTYVGAVLVERLRNIGAELIGFPRLIRLNPNIDWKTRGNCAISITATVASDKTSLLEETCRQTVSELAELHVDTTNPGLAFLWANLVPLELEEFSEKVVRDVVSVEDAEEVASKVGARIVKYKMGRGIIGSLAAIGNNLSSDRTFELIGYRVPKFRGTERRVDFDSIMKMDEATRPATFDNLDSTTGEPRITPHTPCPILFGIRGESPRILRKAAHIIQVDEPVERMLIYETNQGTDQHIIQAKVRDLKAYMSAKIQGRVVAEPKIIRGGHVIVTIADETGEVECAAYEPTRSFTKVIGELRVGDSIEAYGGVKQKASRLTLNLEKIYVKSLASWRIRENPVCGCGKRTTSTGRRKGFVCRRCGATFPPNAFRVREVERFLTLGPYEVPPRARRHLAKPVSRALGLEISSVAQKTIS